MFTAAVTSGLVLGGMYALIAMGLTLQYGVARIMNLAHGELMIAAAFAALWLFTSAACQSAARVAARRARGVCHLLGDLSPAADAPGAPRAEPRRARGRQHFGHLRHAVRDAGRDAGDLRRRLLQLQLPRLPRHHRRRHRRGQSPAGAGLRRGDRAWALSLSDAHAARHGGSRRRGRSGNRRRWWRSTSGDRGARLCARRCAGRGRRRAGLDVPHLQRQYRRRLHHEGADRRHHGRRRQPARLPRRRPDPWPCRNLRRHLCRSRPDAWRRPTPSS